MLSLLGNHLDSTSKRFGNLISNSSYTTSSTSLQSSVSSSSSNQVQEFRRKKSVTNNKTDLSVTLKWVPLAPLGPNAAFHTSSVINNMLYFHGGIKDTSTHIPVPSSQFFKINLTNLLWEEIKTPGSPALSHHASVVLEDRYFTLIGGWNGKKRLSTIYVYDTLEDQWLKMNCFGFPSDAGLSSHTASVTNKGNIIVVGREGSLRLQRKYGNLYIIQGSVQSLRFFYTPLSNSIASRSGHSANFVDNELYILGGRSDSLLEKVVGVDSKKNHPCSVLDNIVSSLVSSKQSELLKFPCGRKHHVSAASTNAILVHGGETFDGKSHTPVGDMFLVVLKPLPKFYSLKNSGLCRSGHACIALPDRLLIHGGKSGKTQIHSGLYELRLESKSE